ncbi:restriction endonuclease subunit S [Alteromonas sp. 5E99-2]|uniref:restriction endonuclease subunit S n=1 Tax=Alteromonas sp. 5E99-2 TaxID=2817683 RepID=UPI001A98EEA6|nr:restriction endonuclease subunit S [Alteromonas sp. 5E99-2]MBO1256699.1 restriction endonuclease subunit S [Alteromonas sp. 5E99-2]
MGDSLNTVPAHWKTKKLVELTETNNISYGVVQPGQHDPDGVPIIRVNNFSANGVDTSEVLKVSPDVAEKYKKTRLIENDVLLTLVGSTGLTYVVNKAHEGWNVPRAVGVIRPVKTINPHWLKICLDSSFTKHFLDSRANTTVQKTLNLSDVKQIPIPIPPDHEREFIESVVLSLNGRISKNIEINRTLEQIVKALFKSWFVDFDPVIDNAIAAGNDIPQALKHRVEQRKQARQLPDFKPLPDDIRVLFPSEFEQTGEPIVGFDGWIPKGWKASNIGSSFDVTMGQSPPGSTYNEIGEGIAFYQGRADFGFRYPKNRVYCTAPKRLANKFDTLVSVRAPVGDANMAKENCAIGRGVAAVRHQSGAISFTYYSIQNLSHYFERYEGEGTVFGSINQKDFKNLPYVAPDDLVISKFEAISSSMDEKVDLNSKNLVELEKLRDNLLPKLISGELGIRKQHKEMVSG